MVESDTMALATELYEEASALERLTDDVWERLQVHPILAPLFAGIPGDQHRHISDFLSDVFAAHTFSDAADGHGHMIARHVGRYFTLQQRRMWMDLVVDAADTLGLADNPQVTMALVGYLEWGARTAVKTPYRRMTVC